MIFFKLITYDTPKIIKVLNNILNFIKYKIARPIISSILYYTKYKSEFLNIAKAINGEKLKNGISYCLVAKNEEVTLPFCLNSVVKFADQIICIDNGSKDKTLDIMNVFKNKYIDVDFTILSLPNKNLCELRQECLKYVKYTHFVRGDADMVFTNNFINYKQKIINKTYPIAIQCKILNLFGDTKHYNKVFKPTIPGEYYLRNYQPDIKYIEYYGRLEHAKIPLYYKMKTLPFLCIIHIDCNKKNERFFYRTCYLDYREYCNKNKNNNTKITFESYEKQWLFNIFKTHDKNSTKYRMARLVGSMCTPFSNKIKTNIKELKYLTDAEQKFKVIYKDNSPYLRIDQSDPFYTTYQPNKEDLSWVPTHTNYYSDKKRLSFTGLFDKQN